MHPSRRRSRTIGLAVALMLACSVPGGQAMGGAPAVPGGQGLGGPPAPTPVTHDGYVVALANGVYRGGGFITDADPDPGRVAQIDHFHSVIAERDAAAVHARKAEVAATVLERFGLDFTASDVIVVTPDHGAILARFLRDPDQAYRVYTIGGQHVPAEGWRLWQGGWGVFFFPLTGNPSPAPIILHGTWGGPAGRVVPPTAFIMAGDYIIDRLHPRGTPNRIVVPFASVAPVVPDDTQRFPVEETLDSTLWSAGRAHGAELSRVLQPDPDPFEVVRQAGTRTIMTFPGWGRNVPD